MLRRALRAESRDAKPSPGSVVSPGPRAVVVRQGFGLALLAVGGAALGGGVGRVGALIDLALCSFALFVLFFLLFH